MNKHILVFYSRYTDVQGALFIGNHCAGFFTEDKRRASTTLLARTDDLLRDHALTISDIDCIAASAGPAPFTTLRVVISTVNGLGFATQKPLIGINTLELLCKEQQQDCIALLNAFCEDVYFCIYRHATESVEMGCANIDTFLESLTKTKSDSAYLFIGNGTELYRDKIQEVLGEFALIPDPCPLEASLQALGAAATKALLKRAQTEIQIAPLYFKEYSAKMNG